MTAIITMLLPMITEVLRRIIPDQEKLQEARSEIEKALVENQAALMQAMSAVMVADSQSTDKFTSRARPLVVYWSLCLITVVATLGAFGMAQPILDALTTVPEKLWDLMTYGIGAFVLGRTVEKSITNFRNPRGGE